MEASVPCEICSKNVPFEEYEEHVDICQALLDSVEEVEEEKVPEIQFTQSQIKSLQYGFKKSKVYSKNIRPNLVIRFKTLGYNEEDLKIVSNYVRTVAPIVIHVNLPKILNHLVDDDHYRNVFEVRTKGDGYLSSRERWEKSRFNDYYRESESSERVKYGALNITCNPQGVPPAIPYGNSYLVLKQETKMRATFLLDDSTKEELHICTFRYFNPVLHYIDDAMIHDLVSLSRKKLTHSNLKYPRYIECQIHGPVRLAHDIEELVVNPAFRNDGTIKYLLDKFRDKHGVNYRFF